MRPGGEQGTRDPNAAPRGLQGQRGNGSARPESVRELDWTCPDGDWATAHCPESMHGSDIVHCERGLDFVPVDLDCEGDSLYSA